MTHDRVLLFHLRDAALRIAEYCGEGAPQFRRSPLLQDGVLRQLRVICDISRRVSPATRARSTTVPWDDFADLATLLARDFFGVSMNALWRTATRDVPPVLHAVTTLLAMLETSRRS